MKRLQATLRMSCMLLWLVFGGASLARAAISTDGFEGSVLSPLWVKSGTGAVTLNRSVVHSGTSSVEMAPSSTILRDFGAEQSGAVSVHVLSRLCCGMSVGLQLTRANGDWVNIQQHAAGQVQTRISVAGVQTGQFLSNAAGSWLAFEIHAGSTGVTVKLNGVAIITDPRSFSFRSVQLDVWGGTSGGSAFVDDYTSILNPVVMDGFEGYVLSPFWVKSGAGAVTLNRAVVYSGASSAEMAPSSTMLHDFGAEQSGSVRVHVLSRLCCGMSVGLQLTRANGDWVNIQQLSTGQVQTRVSIAGVQTSRFLSSSAGSWLTFEIHAGSNGATVQLNGVTILTDPRNLSFRSAQLDVWGGNSGGSAFVDDLLAVL